MGRGRTGRNPAIGSGKGSTSTYSFGGIRFDSKEEQKAMQLVEKNCKTINLCKDYKLNNCKEILTTEKTSPTSSTTSTSIINNFVNKTFTCDQL
jgi:hypothetical protein